MNPVLQEVIVWTIVAMALMSVFRRSFRAPLARILAPLFLRRGRVKTAMKLHQLGRKAGCDGCE